MSSYDVLICVDETMLNQVAASLYARPTLRTKLFTGTQTAAIMGVNVTVAYDMLQVPTVALQAPTAEQWANAIKADGNAAQPVTNAFVVHLPKVKVEKRSTDAPAQTTVAIDVICTVALAGSVVSIDPLAAVVDLAKASDFDRLMYKLMIIPQVLQVVDKLLSGHQLPDIAFAGVQFGNAVLAVGNGRLAAAANLAGKANPAAPATQSLPAGRFVVLLSPAAMQQVANAGTQSLEGKTQSTSGSQSFGIGTAKYSAGVKLKRASVNVNQSDMTRVDAVITAEVNASAGVDMLNAIGGAVESAATTAVNAVGDAAKDAGKAIEKSFKSY